MTSDHVLGSSYGHLWLISQKISDNVGMTLLNIWYSHKKNLRSTSSPKTAHLKCLKTYWLPCKYPIDIFDLTNWSKLIILLPCFQRFSLFSKVYLKSKLWVVKLLKLNIKKSWLYYQTQNAFILQYIKCCPKIGPAQIFISVLWKTVYIRLS